MCVPLSFWNTITDDPSSSYKEANPVIQPFLVLASALPTSYAETWKSPKNQI